MLVPPRVRWVALAAGGLLLAFAVLLFNGGRIPASNAMSVVGFHVALPGLASDAVPAAAAPGAPDARIVIGHVGLARNGGLSAAGEVHNGGGNAIANVIVTAEALSTAGAVLEMRTVSIISREIAAGSDGLFRVAFSAAGSDGASVRLRVASAETRPSPTATASATAGGPGPLELISYDPKTHEKIVRLSETVSVLSGSVTNTSAVPLTNIEVSVALYDGDGNVALVLQGSSVSIPFEPAEGAKLRPGQTGTFTAQVATADLLAIAGSVRVLCFVNAAPAN